VRWTRWCPPNSSKLQLKPRPGVYALITGTTLDKLCGPDPAGILYIGQSANLRSRLRLKTNGEFNHSLLWYTVSKGNGNGQLRVKLGIEALGSKQVSKDAFILFMYRSSKASAVELEQALLAWHLGRFGQSPPLNARSPSMKSMADWWEDWWAQRLMKPTTRNIWNDLLKVGGGGQLG